MNQVVEQNNKLKADLERRGVQTAIVNNSIAATASAPVKQREVEFTTFDKLRARSADTMKRMQASPDELPKY